MAQQRLSLQSKLEEILGSDHVYFQPPPSLALEYDCIVYKRNYIKTDFADNNPYRLEDRYSVTVIYRHPDSDLPYKIASLPKCSFDRHFVSDNLNHDVFNLYF